MQCTIPFGVGMLLKNAIIDTSYPHEGSQQFFLSLQQDYSKVSIRPGRSRLLEFEKKQYWSFNRDVFKKSRPGRLIKHELLPHVHEQRQ